MNIINVHKKNLLKDSLSSPLNQAYNDVQSRNVNLTLNEQKLHQSILSYLNEIQEEPWVAECETIIHLFDVHETIEDSNAIENSEAYYTYQFALIPGSKSKYYLSILETHNYYGYDSLSCPIQSFQANKPIIDLVKEISHEIQSRLSPQTTR